MLTKGVTCYFSASNLAAVSDLVSSRMESIRKWRRRLLGIWAVSECVNRQAVFPMRPPRREVHLLQFGVHFL